MLIDLPPESPLREDVAALLEANHRGSDIARQLLAFAGKEDNHPRAWPLASILRDVVGLASRGAHHVSFELDLEEGLLVDGARDQLAHVFLNLVLNALDALGAGGTVRVEARAVASAGGVAGARVRVIDDGAGMDAAT